MEETIQKLCDKYVSDERARQRHISSRLRQYFDSFMAVVREQSGGEDTVLIRKHFSYVFMEFAGEYSLSQIDFADLVIANNPQAPSELFTEKYGEQMRMLTNSLTSIAEKLADPATAARDYIAWLHVQRQNEAGDPDNHMSIYGPQLFRRIGAADFSFLLKMTKKRIEPLRIL